MRVKSARFVKSFADPAQVTGGAYVPQVCVAGRSNCGKSSLLNTVMCAKLCKTSSTPGRTRLLNLFEVDVADAAFDRFYFVDLPGYGFHSASQAEADEWSERTERYFAAGGGDIAQALCLMDIRREPSALDKMLINYFRDLGLPFTAVLTKSDKLSRSKIGNARIKIAAELGLARDDLIVTSSLDRSGRDELLERLGNVISVFGGG